MKRSIITITVTLVLTLAVSSAFAGPGPGRWSANGRNTPGWQLMTPEERTAHQTKMRGFTEYNACKAYVDDHRAKMAERAKEKGLPAPAMRRNPCDIMKARGYLK